MAISLRIGVGYTDIPIGLYYPSINGIGAIVVPEAAGPLERTWVLAHELGHALQHSGAKSTWSYSKGEAQASRWAACALIPLERIRLYGNASMDAMLAALSAHYEDLPLWDCPARQLAAKIARFRLDSLAQEVA